MAPKRKAPVTDKAIWKKLKRNGYFRKQKKDLLRSIVQPNDNSRKKEVPVSVITAEEIQNEPTPSTSTAIAQETAFNFAQYPENDMNTESEDDDNVDNYDLPTDPQDLCNDLKSWAITHQIKHTAVNSLLGILKPHIPQNNLPNDARTLIQTPRTTNITSDSNLDGQYWHYGLSKVLTEVVSRLHETPAELSLNVNIDGLPTFKSSSKSFWPILVNIHELRSQHSPLVVGIFCGTYKPKDVNAFLEPFVIELNDVLRNGLTVNGSTIKFRLRCFICDTPARSMLRGVIGHNGYSSCLKCVTEGEYSHEYRTMIFPEVDAPLRTDAEFRARVYEGHHKSDSILEQIDGLDMVQDFPIGDALHLIDLGITKRFLNGWKCGTLNNHNAKWSARQIQNVSNFLQHCKLPREIRRPARSLEDLARWKGTEFRTFLLYLSPIVLKQFFESDDISDHFLNFYCAIQILSRHDQPPENYAVARSLIDDFLEGIKVLYGPQLFSSNIHNLAHLVDDVERFGPLDSFDAYPFESRLYTLKRLIRSGNLPLSQVSRRITEIQSNTSNPNIVTTKKQPTLKKRCYVTDDILENNNCTAYSFINLNEFVLDTKSDSDRWVLTSTYGVMAVDYIIHNSIENTICLYGTQVQDLMDFFVKPLVSSSLFIYASNLNLKPAQKVQIDEIRGKMVKINCNSSDLPKAVLIPLIHTLR